MITIKNLPFIIFGGIIVVLGIAVTLTSGNYKGSQKYVDSYVQSMNFDNTKNLVGEAISTIDVSKDAKVIVWIENGEDIKLSFIEKSFGKWNNVDTKGIENNAINYVNFNSVSKDYNKFRVLITSIKNSNGNFNKAKLNRDKDMQIAKYKDYTLVYTSGNFEDMNNKPEIDLYNNDKIIKELNDLKYIKE